MPELPEVETIKNQLLKRVKNQTIKAVQIRDYQKNFQGNKNHLRAKITNIQRRAKQLIFTLNNNHSFLIHLKLTGQLIYHQTPPQEIPSSTHIIFTFQDNSTLLFNDFRKFGYLKIIPTKEIPQHLQNLGPEPLTLNFQDFKTLLQKRPRSKIKPLLLDQSVIAGLGNIYAQEACFKSRILPTRQISTLTNQELQTLHRSIQTILHQAIKHQGTSFDTTYRTTENQPGNYTPYIQVYHQKSCPTCQSQLKILKQNSRSTYYCAKCQT